MVRGYPLNTFDHPPPVIAREYGHRRALPVNPALLSRVKGQVAIITGSARGIGKGIALRLAREGMRVVIHGHIQAETDATAAQLAGLGAEVLAITANFRQEAEIYRVFDETMQAYG